MQLEKYTKKNGDVAWRYRAYAVMNPLTGKPYKIKKSGFKTKKEAQIACTRALNDILENGFQEEKKARTFKECYLEWLKTYELTVKESSFVKLKQKFDNYILPSFGSKLIEKVTVSDVQTFANYMCFDVKNSQYKEYISNISRIFDYGIKQGDVKTNPVKRITIPRPKATIKASKINYYTKKELATFLNYAKENEPTMIYTFFYLLASSGCRQGELLGLQWDCVSLEDKTLRVRQTLTRGKDRRLYLDTPKTKKGLRVIPLNDATITVLKAWRKEQRKEMLQIGVNTLEGSQLVFSTVENDFIQLTHPRLWMHRIAKRSGVAILSPHSLRHTFATILIGEGVNFKTVSELLGHATVAMTLDTYAGVFREEKVDSIALLADFMG